LVISLFFSVSLLLLARGFCPFHAAAEAWVMVWKMVGMGVPPQHELPITRSFAPVVGIRADSWMEAA
jgi:hypothetical protein